MGLGFFKLQKRLKNHLLGSLLKSRDFKNLTVGSINSEVIFLVSCMANDKRIITELEAGSRRCHWEREVYVIGWLVVKLGRTGNTRETLLVFPATDSQGSGSLWKMDPKAALPSGLCITSQSLTFPRMAHVPFTAAFLTKYSMFHLPETQAQGPLSYGTSESHQLECTGQGPGFLLNSP